nr:MAG TPA: hypothetical protein [Caudoviricetes sp.]
MWVLILARGLKRNAAKGITDVLDGMEDRLFGRAPIAQDEDSTLYSENGIDIDKWMKENESED